MASLAALALALQSVQVEGAATVNRRLGEAGPREDDSSSSSSKSSSSREEEEEEEEEESTSSESTSSSSASSLSSSERNSAYSESYSYDSSDEYHDQCIRDWNEADSESFGAGVKYVWCELILHWYIGLGVLFFLLCCCAGEESLPPPSFHRLFPPESPPLSNLPLPPTRLLTRPFSSHRPPRFLLVVLLL